MEVGMTDQKEKEEAPEPEVKKRFNGVGLDVGTMFFVGAEQKDGEIKCKSVRDAFFQMKTKEIMLKMLKDQSIPYLADEEYIFVVGDRSIEFASMHNGEIERPLSKGVINKRIKDKAGSIISKMLEVAIGKAQHEKEICHYSVPSPPLDASYNIGFHEDIFGMYLGNLGYDPRPLNEAEAICYSELSGPDDNMTGMCLSFGAGMTNCALMLYGDAAITFSVARGGDWIDENAAEYSDTTKTDVISTKEDPERAMTINAPRDYDEHAIASYYLRHIKYVVTNFHRYLTQTQVPRFPQPISVILSGGTTLIRGFEEVFKKEFEAVEWPFKIKEVKKSSDPLLATARGCLVASLALGKG